MAEQSPAAARVEQIRARVESMRLSWASYSSADMRFLLEQLDALMRERDAMRETAEWLLAEGGWYVARWERTGPRPAAIDMSDRWHPRLRTAAEIEQLRP